MALIGEEVRKTIIVQAERLGCEIVALNVPLDHVHLLIQVPTKVSGKFPELKQRPYWDNRFGAESYCVDIVGLDSEMIQKYVKYQEYK